MTNDSSPQLHPSVRLRTWIAPAGVLLLLCLLLGMSQSAHAARAWFDGVTHSVYEICPITNNRVISSQSYVGYVTDPAEPYPMTGDVAYVHAVGVNISPCSNDVIGFDFYLPQGAEFAIDGTNKVYCFRGRLSDGYYENVPNASGSACSQTPSPGSSGGGAFFGYSTLPSGWWVEIQVPVRFNKKLLGMAGDNTHKLYAVSKTTWGDAVPEQPVTVFYGADFDNLQASGVGQSSARLDATLMSYYTSGTAYFDYGTSSSYGQSVPVTGITSGDVGFEIFAELDGLVSNADHYWRVRYVTADGTFTSSQQKFRTGSNPSLSHGLTVNRTGTGDGAVVSAPAGIDCGVDCAESFAQGTTVTLTASAVGGSHFTGWTGACSGATEECVVTMSGAKNVSATFTAVQGVGLVALGGASPADAVHGPGDSNVPLLQFELVPASDPLELTELRLRAGGSGDDAADVDGVSVFADENGNGRVDEGETAVAQGQFASDDGTLKLTPVSPVIVDATTRFLVTYDFAPKTAGAAIQGAIDPGVVGAATAPTGLLGAASLGASVKDPAGTGFPGVLTFARTAALTYALAFLLLGAIALRHLGRAVSLRRRLRATAGIAGAVVILTACGGGTGGPVQVGRTYTVTLEEISVENQTTSEVVAVGGVPLAGATVTVK